MFHLSIITIDKKIFEGRVLQVTVPGIEGQLSILKNHLPLITALKEGTTEIKFEDKEKKFPIQKGILEVRPNEVVILADT